MHGGNRDPWEGLRGNLLLRTLAPHDAFQLAGSLERVHLPAGSDLPGQAVGGGALVCFPETAIVCLGLEEEGGGGYQTGLIGREGMLGWASLLGFAEAGHCGRVQLKGGTALVMPAPRLQRLCAQSPELLRALMRFAHLFALQMAATLLSNLHDSVERRLSRWLLMFHDRLEGDELAITHDAFAAMLNIRRPSVTDALHVLEGERLVRCARGRIIVCDRLALQARAGSGYGATEQRYRGLIGPFGKGG
jgi:CRP-like cAMP-binding protein